MRLFVHITSGGGSDIAITRETHEHQRIAIKPFSCVRDRGWGEGPALREKPNPHPTLRVAFSRKRKKG